MIKWVETYNKCIHYRKSVTVTVIKFSGEQLNYSISYLRLEFQKLGGFCRHAGCGCKLFNYC